MYIYRRREYYTKITEKNEQINDKYDVPSVRVIFSLKIATSMTYSFASFPAAARMKAAWRPRNLQSSDIKQWRTRPLSVVLGTEVILWPDAAQVEFDHRLGRRTVSTIGAALV